jgi:AcrR family transcriptional regulator
LGRHAKFTEDQIIDTASKLISLQGPDRISMAGVAAHIGAPTGSIYYRFASRDLLMARTWIRTVKRAQTGFIKALADPDPRTAAIEAALHIVRWSRSHLAEARVLLLYRREDLASDWPVELGEELKELNRPIERAVKNLVRRLPEAVPAPAPGAVSFALIDVPYGAVRRHLAAGKPPPAAVDRLVELTCDCVLFGHRKSS